MFPPKTEKPDFLGFSPARASGERFRGPLALVWPVGEGCYLVPGEPIAPGEKGLMKERTDEESGDEPRGSATTFVTDMATAAAFYTEILGLRLQYRAGRIISQ